ncbi:transglutaminase domain-containing protein [Salinibacterium sp. ZJ450]|uniref:transglutaminase domain-containing protein n=1 Tax=Salinibacterium sp. ZJ450 TaxID=2708338 RepID=UPI00141F5C27|nr:transglutaminase domain-containing protein [Salinibacterium sp. ZJ450]
MRRPSAAFVIISTIMVWTTTAIAIAAWWPIYQSTHFVVMAVLTTLLASAVAILGSLLRLTAPVLAATGLLTLLAFGVPLAVPDRALFGWLPTVEGLTDLASGLFLGWKQLLTITVPVGSYESLLVPPMVLILVSVIVALSVALRAPFGELGVIAPALLFLTGLAFGTETEWWPRLLTLGMLAACLLWLVWRRWYRRRGAIRLLAKQAPDAAGRPLETVRDRLFPGARSLVGVGVILCVASVAAASAVTALPPGGDRIVLRSTIEQPFDPRDYVSPLIGFRNYLQPGADAETLMTISGLPEDGRIRLATLDTFDGMVYSVGSDEVDSASGSFTRVPSDVDQSQVDGRSVTVDVSIDGYDGVWLPTVGAFEAIDFAGQDATGLREAFYYNDNSRTAAVLGGVGAGARYRLTAVIPTQPTDRELATLIPGDAAMPPLAAVPDGLPDTLDDYTSGIEQPGAKLVAALDGLARDGYVSHGIAADEPRSRSGHAADRITELLADDPMIGDAEQYAVAAALMARQIGFPARVVFGFAPGATAQPVQVTGSDVAAWVEVHTTEFGWVSLDPTPAHRDIPEQQPEDPTQVSRPQSVLPPPVVQDENPNEQSPPQSTEEIAPPDPFLAFLFAALRVAGVSLVLLAMIASPFLLVVAAKVQRRRRRQRAKDPVQNIRGGWQEFEDALLDHGYQLPASATRRELAAVAGGAQARVLAAVTDRAVFSPSTPAPDDTTRVWHAVHDLRAALGRGQTRWQRLKALLSARSLGSSRSRGRYSGKKLFRRQGR